MKRMRLGEITIDVVQKDIRNVHLSVYPPTGRVRISAPLRMNPETIRVFAISKLGWIKKQQVRQKSQEREPRREFINRESHYFLGKRYLLRVTEKQGPPNVTLKHHTIQLSVRPGTKRNKRAIILDEWYRQKLKEIVPGLISKWAKQMGVSVNDFGIKRMKTKWGTCNQDAKRIWLNLELAKKPIACLEYIIVHEMVHLLERSHNDRFVALMDNFMPHWKFHKQELNQFPVSHQAWDY